MDLFEALFKANHFSAIECQIECQHSGEGFSNIDKTTHWQYWLYTRWVKQTYFEWASAGLEEVLLTKIVFSS